jgi:hypothetical protein
VRRWLALTGVGDEDWLCIVRERFLWPEVVGGGVDK